VFILAIHCEFELNETQRKPMLRAN